MSIPAQNYNSDPKGLIPRPAGAHKKHSKMTRQYVTVENVEGKAFCGSPDDE
jgi:hypothetical protein